MDDLLLNLSNGTKLYSPATLSSITTYVVLEQESWFEKEFGFLPRLIRPGMTAIDIGANLGVYSMALAKLVGPSGRVYAYEPTTTTRESLTRSRDANGFTNLEIIGSALSDTEREGRIVFGGSSELNHLGDAGEGEGEAVHLTSLDIEAERHGWGVIDFIKIDAEGEEEAILRGGKRFFAEGSPIVMMEVKAAAEINRGLVDAIAALGYQTYKLLRDPLVLVPAKADELELAELNVLAMKPERAAELAERDLLIETAAEWTPEPALVEPALARLRSQPFAAAFPAQFRSDAVIEPNYADALAAYDVWRFSDRPLGDRWNALTFASRMMQALCTQEPRFAWLSTLARVAGDRGQGKVAASAAVALMRSVGPKGVQLGEPFWPAMARFDELPPGGKPAEWFLAAAAETLEMRSGLSTAFSKPSQNLDWLCRTPFASPALLRRQYLHAARRGVVREVPQALTVASEDNVNGAFWAANGVAALVPQRAGAEG